MPAEPAAPRLPTGPVLREGELLLRPPRRDDVPRMERWWADDEVLFGFCSEPRAAAALAAGLAELEQEALDTGHWIDFVIEVSGAPIGSIWLAGWDLDERACDLNLLIGEAEYRRRGWARRAIRLLCAWAFRAMELRRIDICPREDHVPAIRCYLAAGARMGGIEPEVMSWRGETVCFREMFFLREDFLPPGPAAPAR